MELIHPAGRSCAGASPRGLHPNHDEHQDIVNIVFGNGHICKQNIGMIRKIKPLDRQGSGALQRLGEWNSDLDTRAESAHRFESVNDASTLPVVESCLEFVALQPKTAGTSMSGRLERLAGALKQGHFLN